MRDGVTYYRYVPSPPLSRFVASIWYAENEPDHRLERFLPTVGVDLVVNVRDAELTRFETNALDRPRRYVGPVVSGAHSRPYVIPTTQQAALLGVKFKLGMARQVLGLPVDVVGNDHVALSEIWGSAAFALQESVMTANSAHERCRRVEAALVTRLRDGRGAHPAIPDAVRALSDTTTPSPVSVAADAAGLSLRRFIEVFRRDVGLAPKQFARVARFYRALQALNTGLHDGLSTLAVEAGYYDQAHFSREFKALAEMSPTAYLATSGAYDNQVPLGGSSVQDTTHSVR
jgi:methylphosphotriester-DNA--protein-cysteine methyltransferase